MPKTQAAAKAPPVDGRRVLAYTDPATLQPYDRNARTHTDEQVRQIRASIEQFGFNAPILLKEDGSTIGAGHGRWMAAMLDPPLPEVPVITLRGLSEAQWRAYVIADNKIALNSVWNDELLRSELADLERQGVNLAIAGFTPEELDAIHRGWDSDLGALERHTENLDGMGVTVRIVLGPDHKDRADDVVAGVTAWLAEQKITADVK
jgi:ParB-like chromosome segregation protein Spo0J